MRVEFANDPETGSLSLLIDHVEMQRWDASDAPAWTGELQAVFAKRDELKEAAAR